jgi:trehalose synthase
VFETVDTDIQQIAPYRALIGEESVEELQALASNLRGARILQLNATQYGGGVAELLSSLVPLERGLGLDVTWGTIAAEPRFYQLTKRLHNALQGATEFEVDDAELGAYISHNAMVEQEIRNAYDFIIVHDPQPLPTRGLAGTSSASWVWRIHIDMAAHNPEAWELLRPFTDPYDRYVFTLPEFVPSSLDEDKVRLIAPAIDPLSPKNMPLPDELTRRLVEWFGVEPDRPLLTQVSRFDRWKDPAGVIDVYRELRAKHPDLQLALLGSMATDDPEGWDVYREIMASVRGDTDIHVRTNLTGIGNIEVNAFQRWSDVIIQKSIREGFGLVVSEALWKATPIVAGHTGGIPLQVGDGDGGFLVSEPADWRRRVDELLSDPTMAHEVGAKGRERVREHFLITRLLRDELQLLGELNVPDSSETREHALAQSAD